MRMCSIAVACALGLLSLLPASALAQPANDSCQAAQVVLVNTSVTGNNINANIDILQSPCTDDLDSFDVWYRLNAGLAGVYTIDTIGSQMPDTTLTVYGFCPASGLLACNDDIDFDQGNFLSRVQLSLNASQSVYIRVAGYGLDEGIFTLNVQGPSAATGVCCRGSTCALNATVATCTGANTRFIQASACNVSGNVTTPCCKADFNKQSGITVQDVFDFLGAWFASSPDANFTGNGAGTPTVQSVFDYLAAWFAGGC